jgi:hypothetical protein
MDGDAAAVGRHARLIQRALQLRLVAQQQCQGLRPLDRDLNARRSLQRAVDPDLHMAEFGRIKPERQPLRAVRSVCHRHQYWSNLRCGRGRCVSGR